MRDDRGRMSGGLWALVALLWGLAGCQAIDRALMARAFEQAERESPQHVGQQQAGAALGTKSTTEVAQACFQAITAEGQALDRVIQASQQSQYISDDAERDRAAKNAARKRWGIQGDTDAPLKVDAWRLPRDLRDAVAVTRDRRASVCAYHLERQRVQWKQTAKAMDDPQVQAACVAASQAHRQRVDDTVGAELAARIVSRRARDHVTFWAADVQREQMAIQYQRVCGEHRRRTQARRAETAEDGSRETRPPRSRIGALLDAGMVTAPERSR